MMIIWRGDTAPSSVNFCGNTVTDFSFSGLLFIIKVLV